MARNKNRHVLRDIVEIIALLPWWLGVVLGIASYLALHRFTIQNAGLALTGEQSKHFLARAVFQGWAEAFQYIVPVVCLVGAGVSFWKKTRRTKLVQVATSNPTARVLDTLSWQEFEALVAEGFRLKGYRVLELGGSAPDGGIDLHLMLGPEQYLVQCKHWKAFKVGVEVVRALYGVMAAKGAAGGFVVTSGTFTRGAIDFADGRNIGLINGEQLASMLQQAKKSAPQGSPSIDTAPASLTLVSAPRCPSCGASMVKRNATRGSHAGETFWGCASYPTCKGIRKVHDSSGI